MRKNGWAKIGKGDPENNWNSKTVFDMVSIWSARSEYDSLLLLVAHHNTRHQLTAMATAPTVVVLTRRFVRWLVYVGSPFNIEMVWCLVPGIFHFAMLLIFVCLHYYYRVQDESQFINKCDTGESGCAHTRSFFLNIHTVQLKRLRTQFFLKRVKQQRIRIFIKCEKFHSVKSKIALNLSKICLSFVHKLLSSTVCDTSEKKPFDLLDSRKFIYAFAIYLDLSAADIFRFIYLCVWNQLQFFFI